MTKLKLQEKRIFPRLPKSLPVKLKTSAYPNCLEATTRNISEGGMLIEAVFKEEKFFSYGLQKGYLSLEVELPSQNCKFESLSKIVWRRKTEREGAYEAGVKFVKVRYVQRITISSYILKETIKTFPLFVQNKIPHYILCSKQIPVAGHKRIIGEIILFFATMWIRRQKAFIEKSRRLSKESTKKLYDFEAKKYLWKHGKTTHRKDDSWRLWLAQILLTKIKEVNALQNRAANHLDLFAGTGLSYLSQAKVFYLNDVNVDSLLLDYSAGMLNVAKEVTIPHIIEAGYAAFIPSDIHEDEKARLRRKHSITVEVKQGDATNLTGEREEFNSKDENVKLPKEHFDAVSIMFGIGSVSLQMAMVVSNEILEVIKEGGRFAITDMHQPIEELAGRWGWPFPLDFRCPWFEKEAYRRICVPYALNRLWGWYDPTPYPHLMKLCVIKKANFWYSWEEISFVIESQSWDFDLPVMPTYKQVLTKVRICEEEAKKRMDAVNELIGRVGFKTEHPK